MLARRAFAVVFVAYHYRTDAEALEHAGGLGLGMVDECLIGEELAYGCMGIYTVLMASELGITPILVGGTEEQQKRFLGPLTEKPSLAAFALSEPDNGSDAAGMHTTAVLDGDEWVINGTKMWITNGSIADVAVVWAQTEDRIRGFVVPTDTPGFSAPEIHRKLSLRASVTSELVLEDVRLPGSAMLPGARGLGGDDAQVRARVFAATFIGFLVERLIRDEPLVGRERKAFIRRVTDVFEALAADSPAR